MRYKLRNLYIGWVYRYHHVDRYRNIIYSATERVIIVKQKHYSVITCDGREFEARDCHSDNTYVDKIEPLLNHIDFTKTTDEDIEKAFKHKYTTKELMLLQAKFNKKENNNDTDIR